MRTFKRLLRKILFSVCLGGCFLALFIEGPSGLLAYVCTALAIVVSVLCAMAYDYYEEMILLHGAQGEKYSLADLVMDGLLLCARTQQRFVREVFIHPYLFADGEDVARDFSRSNPGTPSPPQGRIALVRRGHRHY